MNDNTKNPYSRTITFATLVLVVVVLRAGKPVFLPFTIAILISFVLAPFVSKLQRSGIPKVLSVCIATLISFTLTGAIAWGIAKELVDIAGGLPNYRDTLRAKIEAIKSPVGSNLVNTGQTVSELWKEFSNKIAVGPPQRKAARVEVIEPSASPLEMLQLAIEPFTGAGIVIVSVIFILLKREDLRDRFIRLLGRGSLHRTTQALNDTAQRLSRHLSMLFLVNSGIAAAVSLGLIAIGVPNAVLWGVVAGVLRFIPFAGIWVAAAFPAILSIAVFNSWWPLIFVAAFFVVVEIAVANFIEPWLYGTRTGVSSLALIGSAIFWGWLWGVAGLFVATPLTVCLVVIGKYFPGLKFFHVLLGDEPVLEPAQQFYQRLLGMNLEEAQESFRLFRKESKGLAVFDDLLVPVIIRSQ